VQEKEYVRIADPRMELKGRERESVRESVRERMEEERERDRPEE
jgi:hypothetical protein